MITVMSPTTPSRIGAAFRRPLSNSERADDVTRTTQHSPGNESTSPTDPDTKSRLRRSLEVFGAAAILLTVSFGALLGSVMGVFSPKLSVRPLQWEPAPAGAESHRDAPPGTEHVTGSFEIVNDGGFAVEVVSFGPDTAPGWTQLGAEDEIGPVRLTPDERTIVEIHFAIDCAALSDERWDPVLRTGGVVPLDDTFRIDLGRQPIEGFDIGTIEGRGDQNPLLEEWHLQIARRDICERPR